MGNKADYSIDRLIELAIALNAEKDVDRLLERILLEAMSITNCDGGTVYILEREKLVFNNVITKSKNTLIRGSAHIDIPPIPMSRNHISTLAALEHRRINVKDVYNSDEFDFSGTKNYDKFNDYITSNMLVMPMEDEKGEVIGVLQLINSMDEDYNFIPFDEGNAEIISALASFAAVSLNNKLLSQSVLDILHSFVQVLIEAVDIRSSYNANHTKSMVNYAKKFMDWMDIKNCPYRIKEAEKDPYLMSIWLHDVGKLLVPLEVMNKATRLGDEIETFNNRVKIAKLMERLRMYEKPEEKEEAEEKLKQIEEGIQFVLSVNNKGFADENTINGVKELAKLKIQDENGEIIDFLTESEVESLCIIRGTLTDGERHIMESHVEYTAKLLGNMSFRGIYESVPFWAGSHHELLDGSGYPLKMAGDELPFEVRLLTILDVYDALTAEDRPYKPPLAPEKAFDVLNNMAQGGKIDSEILELFKVSEAWKK